MFHESGFSREALLATFAGLLLCGLPWTTASAAEVRIAVAANFAAAARELGAAFGAGSEHRASLRPGATGQLYAQAANGAPFDVLLAADRARPARAISDGLAVAGSRVTYALGRLVLYSENAQLVKGEVTARTLPLRRLAIANPATAPYGEAAMQVLEQLGALERAAPLLVRGASVTQALQFVVTGNAEAGFVARSQVVSHRRGSRWLVPDSLHAPIAQDAVVLTAARDAPAAQAFVDFLVSPAGRAIIGRHGYALP